MIEHYFKQAKRNEDLLLELEKDQDKFNDWKCTICFYIAIHYLKTLAESMKVEIGNKHSDIFKNINPKTKPKPIIQIPEHIFASFKLLYDNSHLARYGGVKPSETMFDSIMKNNFIESQDSLTNEFVPYINKRLQKK